MRIAEIVGRESTALAILLIFCAASGMAQTPTSTFRSQSNVVLVPTLVTNESGEILRGLSANDFILEEDGVEQKIVLDDAPDSVPISLVVAVQRGGTAYLQFQSTKKPPPCGFPQPCVEERKSATAALSGLGTMVEDFVGGMDAEVAVVTFDSRVELLQDFTRDVPQAARELGRLTGSGDGGGAILDAVSYSLSLLESRPQGRRRVLLLVSENSEHGSRKTKLDDVVRQVAVSNALVFSVAFSQVRAKLVREIKGESTEVTPGSAPVRPGQRPTDPNANPGPNLVMPLVKFAMSLMAKNTAHALAELTGGEYRSFRDQRSFDSAMGLMGNHVRSYYLLSFQPKELRPGPHAITVRLRDPQPHTLVSARNSYWAVGTSAQ